MFEEKTFRGIYIPKEVDTPQGRAAVRVGHELDKNGCFLAGAGRPLCGLVSCAGCIACSNLGDKKRKREVFEQYDREFPVKTEGCVPKLVCGTVIELENGDYFLIEGPVGVPVEDAGNVSLLRIYHKERSFGIFVDYRVELQARRPLNDVVAIYGLRGPLDRGYESLYIGDLHDILNGGDSHIIWKKPAPVKEMTVDEISKALGFKVKVVGSEKADD